MNSNEVLEQLENVGAITTDGHFVYTSGNHGPGYINMDPLFPYVDTVADLCNSMTDFVYNEGVAHPDVVIGAATGGIPLAVFTAYEIGGNTKAVWADKVGKDEKGTVFALDRLGFAQMLNGANVLVVEDLLNTGGTVKKIIALVRKHGGVVIGVSAICNRGDQTAESLDVPKLVALSEISLESFESDECSECARHVPIITDVGHGAEYSKNHPDYPGGYTTLSL